MGHPIPISIFTPAWAEDHGNDSKARAARANIPVRCMRISWKRVNYDPGFEDAETAALRLPVGAANRTDFLYQPP
jgi:hypothetical protein